MSSELLDEAADYLATFADEDERARELSRRLGLVAAGVEEAWPRGEEERRVQWTEPETGAAVVAVEMGGGWEVAGFAPGEDEARAGDRVETLGDAVEWAAPRLLP